MNVYQKRFDKDFTCNLILKTGFPNLIEEWAGLSSVSDILLELDFFISLSHSQNGGRDG